MKNSPLDIVIITIGVLLLIDIGSTSYIMPIFSISAITTIMIYLLASGVKYRVNEVGRIRNSQIPYWEYQKKSIDWNSILYILMFSFGYFQISGTMKYMTLIMGILFLCLFLTNTFLAITNELHILALDENELIDIKNKIEILELSRFKISEETECQIKLKGKWENVKILKADFRNGEDVIDKILNKMKIAN